MKRTAILLVFCITFFGALPTLAQDAANPLESQYLFPQLKGRTSDMNQSIPCKYFKEARIAWMVNRNRSSFLDQNFQDLCAYFIGATDGNLDRMDGAICQLGYINLLATCIGNEALPITKALNSARYSLNASLAAGVLSSDVQTKFNTMEVDWVRKLLREERASQKTSEEPSSPSR